LLIRKGIEAASEKDIADMIIQFIEKRFETMETAKDKSPARPYPYSR
jgi:ribosomal protein S6--L-glutamate ligase